MQNRTQHAHPQRKGGHACNPPPPHAVKTRGSLGRGALFARGDHVAAARLELAPTAGVELRWGPIRPDRVIRPLLLRNPLILKDFQYCL